MNWSYVLEAALLGYLIGSISFARVIMRLLAPGESLEGITMDIPGASEPLHSDAVAGTAVATKLGDRLGCLTAWLDILKVFVPTLAFRLLLPGTDYFLICAGAGLVGHIWPIYYRFKGGRGLSPTIGGFLVLDPLGTAVTMASAMVLGLAVFRNILFAYTGFVYLMAPWIWFRTRNPAYLAYVLFIIVVLSIALIPEIRLIRDRRRRGVGGDYNASFYATPMGRGLQRVGSRLGLALDKKGRSDASDV